MDRKAGDGVHRRLPRGIDGDIIAQPLDEWGQFFKPLLGDQDGPSAMTAIAGQNVQHHFALGDETAEAAGEIALAHIAKHGDAWIKGIIDENSRRQVLGFGCTRASVKSQEIRVAGGVY